MSSVKYLVLALVAFVGACSTTCERPQDFEPIAHCGVDCDWNRN